MNLLLLFVALRALCVVVRAVHRAERAMDRYSRYRHARSNAHRSQMQAESFLYQETRPIFLFAATTDSIDVAAQRHDVMLLLLYNRERQDSPTKTAYHSSALLQGV